jgi:protein-S-isoprenylcysteine O-methyltransferase Ste14
MSHVARHVFWTIVCPGTVTVLLPYFILQGHSIDFREHWFSSFTGIILICLGMPALLSSIFMFARHGDGTLSPADPAHNLVINGLYRYVRNPMYVGVMLILVGEALLFRSWTMVIYAGIAFLCFNLFIIFYEEPYLSRHFGQPYEEYRKHVHRWLPGKRYIQ